MSEIKWTKGPWVFDEHDNLIADGGNLKVRGISIPNGYAKEETTANMHLIAAAPDLYEALDTLASTLDSSGMKLITVDAHAALAKARGESCAK